MIKAINIDKELVDMVKNKGVKNFSKLVSDLIRKKFYTEKKISEKKKNKNIK